MRHVGLHFRGRQRLRNSWAASDVNGARGSSSLTGAQRDDYRVEQRRTSPPVRPGWQFIGGIWRAGAQVCASFSAASAP